MVKDILYTPILKWKKAEENAIRDLSNSQKDSVLPVFEFVQPVKVSDKLKDQGIKNVNEWLIKILSESIPQDIFRSWGGGRLFFADFTLIEPIDIRIKFAERFIANSVKSNLEPILVVNIESDIAEYVSFLVAQSRLVLGSKVCLRFTKIGLSSLTENLSSFHEDYGAISNNVSILIDLKEDTSEELFLSALESLSKVKSLNEYDNVIVASGAFPEDMSRITTEDDRRPRKDWNNWFNNRLSCKISRYPSFADYTVRYPIYNPLVEHCRATATIKYTLSDEWRFLKGKVGDHKQYLAYASVFRENEEFYGRDFSAGDKFIDDKGLHFEGYEELPVKERKPGNASQWIYACMNHHVAVVVDQIAGLTADPTE
jgi:hypothetical protein